MTLHYPIFSFFFFNDTATTEIYTLSLHDALPIYHLGIDKVAVELIELRQPEVITGIVRDGRSEEHTSELQSRSDLVCRLLLEKKKKQTDNNQTIVEYYSRTDNRRTCPWPTQRASSHPSPRVYC